MSKNSASGAAGVHRRDNCRVCGGLQEGILHHELLQDKVGGEEQVPGELVPRAEGRHIGAGGKVLVEAERGAGAQCYPSRQVSHTSPLIL
jgi:hypothetical protein